MMIFADFFKVPSHMPHYIDKTILRKLQETFPNEFEKTSSHKIRSADDFAFSFGYYYFLMNDKRCYNSSSEKEILELLRNFDLDHSG